MTRRSPIAELAKLVRFERFTFDRQSARLARAVAVTDLRKIAKRRTPRLLSTTWTVPPVVN